MSVNETTEAKYTTNPPRISGVELIVPNFRDFFLHMQALAMVLWLLCSLWETPSSTGKYNQVAFYSAAAAVKFGNRLWWRWQ